MLFENVTNNSDNASLYSLYEGYISGNMFKNLFEQYKNYTKYDLLISSEKQKLLYELMMLDFAINDLHLHLIMHADDNQTTEVYKQYKKMYKNKLKNYINLYGECEELSLPWEVTNV